MTNICTRITLVSRYFVLGLRRLLKYISTVTNDNELCVSKLRRKRNFTLRLLMDFIQVCMALINNHLTLLSRGFHLGINGFNCKLFGTNFVGISSRSPWLCKYKIPWLEIWAKSPETIGRHTCLTTN